MKLRAIFQEIQINGVPLLLDFRYFGVASFAVTLHFGKSPVGPTTKDCLI